MVCDPVRAGIAENGQPLYYWRPRDPVNRVQLTPDLAKSLGFTVGYPKKNTRILRALINASIVVGEKISDRTYLLDLDDWYRFLKDCEDPQYWDAKKIAQLNAAYDR